MDWLTFFLCAAAIVYAGRRLARDGALVADRLGFGRAWFGMAFVASVTSLPELVTGLSASAVARLPDIALGDALGSCSFNLALFGVVAIVMRGAVTTVADARSVRRAALWAVAALACVGWALVLGKSSPNIDGLRFPALAVVLIGGYAMALRSLSSGTMSRGALGVPSTFERASSQRRALRRFALAALIVFTAGTLLPFSAQSIAEEAGLQLSFVGVLFVATATSLPEIIVTVTALKARSSDLALGSLVGSNLFNLAIVGIDTLAYPDGDLFAHASKATLVPVAAAMTMSASIAATFGRAFDQRRLGVWLLFLFAVSAYGLYAIQH